jgi:hypothetical protein
VRWSSPARKNEPKRRKAGQAPEREPTRDAAEYYRLKTQAVEDLVTANEENSPDVSRKELRKYTVQRGRLHLADWVKLLLIKWWFPAAVCYFFIWGLGAMVPNVLDQLVIAGIALGFVTDLLTNNVLRFMARTSGANDRWMMYPRKGFWSLPLNVLYAGVIMFLVYTAYNVLNRALIALNGLPGDAVPLGVGPILFGLLCLGFDLMLIGMKHGFQKIIAEAQRKAGAGRG